jgi:hypothetical protein
MVSMVHATLGIPAPTWHDGRDGLGGVRSPPGRGASACRGLDAAGGARGSRSSPRPAESAPTPKLGSGLIAVLQRKSARSRSSRCSRTSLPITRSIPCPHLVSRACADQPLGLRRAAGRDHAEQRAQVTGSVPISDPARPLRVAVGAATSCHRSARQGSFGGRSLWVGSLFRVVCWPVTLGPFALLARIRLAADCSRVRSGCASLGWSGADGKDACDRNPEPTQPWGGAWHAQAPGSLVEFLERPSEEEPSYLHCHRNFCQMVS